jgi:hypothetical protein
MPNNLQTLISLDHLHCNSEADPGSGEPYLWTASFTIDGDTLRNGPFVIVTSPGSHGNLGDSDVDAGDDVPIPAELGERRFTLTPMPGDGSRDSWVGVVVALLESNWTTDAAAEAGHVAFNQTLEQAIGRLLNDKANEQNPRLTDHDIATVKAEVTAAVVEAIKAESSWSELLDHDVPIDAQFFFATDRTLSTSATQEVTARFQRVVELPPPPSGPGFPPGPNTVVADDYTLIGEILGVEPSPLGFSQLRRSAEHGTPPAAGAPAACFESPRGVRNIVYRDTEGHLHELWQDAAGLTGTADLTSVIGGPTAAGNPSLYVDTVAGQLLVLYRGTDGHVHCLYTGGHDDLSGAAGAPDAAGDPVGTHNPATNINHVVYRGVDGQLHVLYWTAADDRPHYEGPLRATVPGAVTPPPAGDPSMFFDGRNNVVVYRATDGEIHSLYWWLDEAGHDALSGFAGTPTAHGEPVANYIPELDLIQIMYRGNDDHLYEIYSAGGAPAQPWDLTAWVPGAPLAASDPAIYYVPADNSTHVVYRSTDNHLHELSWIQGQVPAHVDLTVAGLARRAVDKPAAFAVAGPNTQHVVYRSTDNEIREIRWSI